MKSYLVWDQADAAEGSATEIEAANQEAAALEYAKRDPAWMTEGRYSAPRPICVKHESTISTYAVEYDPNPSWRANIRGVKMSGPPKIDPRETAPGKKLYIATAEREVEFCVWAENKKAAQSIADDNVDDEFKNIWGSDHVNVSLADPSRITAEHLDSVPYGTWDDDEKTVGELVEQLKEAQREAEERARIEANQLKLPLGGQS